MKSAGLATYSERLGYGVFGVIGQAGDGSFPSKCRDGTYLIHRMSNTIFRSILTVDRLCFLSAALCLSCLTCSEKFRYSVFLTATSSVKKSAILNVSNPSLRVSFSMPCTVLEEQFLFLKYAFLNTDGVGGEKPQNAFDGNGEDIFIPKPQRRLPKNRSFIHWLSFLFSLFGCIWHKTCCVSLLNGKEKRSRGDVEGIGGVG